jgi:RND family efflux transporter MFP subunit
MRFESKLVLPVVLAAGLAGTLAGCGNGAKASLPTVDQGAATAAGVRIVQPSARLDGSGLTVTGQLRSRNEATLSAPAGGQVVKLFVDVGDRVKKEQPLIQIDPSNVSIQVEQARAARAVAEAGFKSAARELERTKQLRASDGAPEAALDRMQSAYDQAAAGYEQAKAAAKMAEEVLHDHTLRAPFDGVISARMVKLGETVASVPPTQMIALVDPQHLEVRLPVPEAVAGSVAVGAKLAGTVSPSGKPFEAQVRAIGAAVEQLSRTVEVLADVTSPIAPELRPGALVDVSLVAGDTAGVYVPAEAVQKDGDKHFVWIDDADKAKRREVEATPVSTQFFHVRSGLGVEDRVVRDGAAGLKEGMALRILD